MRVWSPAAPGLSARRSAGCWSANSDATVLNVDKLTYAANLTSLRPVEDNPRYAFRRADICDRETISNIFREFDPGAVLHLAAKSHVDRSIDGPAAFIRTNIEGTYILLEDGARSLAAASGEARKQFRFHHVSTDEVFGSLGTVGKFTETTAYRAEFALFSIKGGFRSPGPRLARDLRVADRGQQLLE